jgi:hypothetical protein
MKTTRLFLASICLLSAACKKADPVTTTATSTGPGPVLSQVLSATPSGEAQTIPVARTTAKPGDEITLKGRIMGSSSPFVEGRAMFILGDGELLTPCNEIPGDECDTPWDVCCETAADKKLGTATIQIVDADGRVIKERIEGVAGIEKLARVTVTGKVAEGSSPDLLLINATAIRAGD